MLRLRFNRPGTEGPLEDKRYKDGRSILDICISHQVVHQYPSSAASYQCYRAGTVGELAESAPSWRHYRQEFLRTMAFGEWETYDHPVACEHSLLAKTGFDYSLYLQPDLSFALSSIVICCCSKLARHTLL